MNEADHGPLFEILFLLHLERTRNPREDSAIIEVVGLNMNLRDIFINEVSKANLSKLKNHNINVYR